jgi:hypothetical protein
MDTARLASMTRAVNHDFGASSDPDRANPINKPKTSLKQSRTLAKMSYCRSIRRTPPQAASAADASAWSPRQAWCADAAGAAHILIERTLWSAPVDRGGAHRWCQPRPRRWWDWAIGAVPCPQTTRRCSCRARGGRASDAGVPPPPLPCQALPFQACRGLARQGWRNDALGRSRSQEPRSGRRSLGRSRVTNPIRPAAMPGTIPLPAA